MIPIGLPKATNVIVHHFLKTLMDEKKSLPAKRAKAKGSFLQVLHIVANQLCIELHVVYTVYIICIYIYNEGNGLYGYLLWCFKK